MKKRREEGRNEETKEEMKERKKKWRKEGRNEGRNEGRKEGKKVLNFHDVNKTQSLETRKRTAGKMKEMIWKMERRKKNRREGKRKKKMRNEIESQWYRDKLEKGGKMNKG